MSPPPPYGVLLVAGLRTHQENYAELFAAEPRCRMVAVADEADVPPQRAAWNRALAVRLGLPYIPDLSSALAREDVHLVSVCAEHERRGRVAVACARAGKHLYLDKPIACSVADADAIVEAVEAAGVRSQMFSFNHYSWVRRAQRIVESGELGELVTVHCEVLFAKGHLDAGPPQRPRVQDPHPTRFTFPDSKRELRATGVYSAAIIRQLTGREVQSVYGVTANYFFAAHARNHTEDFGLLVLNLEGGLTATITAGRIGWQSHPGGGPMRCYLVGTRRACKVDAYAPRLEVCACGEPWSPPPPHPEDPMAFWNSTCDEMGARPKQAWALFREPTRNDVSTFLDCIEQGCESAMNARSGAALVETLMAGYISAARGEVVPLPLPR